MVLGTDCFLEEDGRRTGRFVEDRSVSMWSVPKKKKTTNARTHNAVDCDCDNGAIVAGLSIALCHCTGS